MEEQKKAKRKRIAVKLLVATNEAKVSQQNDKPLPSKDDSETALYKQANNPLGDPNKV